MDGSSRRHPARILDANANRAREALRVLEDAARFLLDDADLAIAFKQLRHDLVQALELLPPGTLQSHRASEEDVGRSLEVDSESHRPDERAVLEAASGRVGEALRSIEEWSKMLDPQLAKQIEALRYRAYESAGLLVSRFAMVVPQWRICLLLTRSQCRRPALEVLHGALAGGVDCIQIREKALPERELLAWVEEVIAVARPMGVAVVVNDRVDIALAAGADGVHLGQSDLPVAAVRRIAGHRLLVGVSTHDLLEAEEAIRAGCDFCGVGAMFTSSTKPECEPSGPSYLQAFLQAHPDVPHLAIGGIDAVRAGELSKLGCRGVAVSNVICAAEEPEVVARALFQAISPLPESTKP